MALPRTEMRKRLQHQLADRKKKLDRLAAKCEQMEPGEAVQILQQLDDDTLAEVLRLLESQTALKIAALLKRLGREGVVPGL